MRSFTSEKQKIGKTGEDLAIKYLKSKGLYVVCRNYSEKCGEIDIIAVSRHLLHFIEVKSVSCEIGNIETAYRPEENLNRQKYMKLVKTAEMFLVKHYKYTNYNWQIDLVCVNIDHKRRIGRVRFLQNILFN